MAAKIGIIFVDKYLPPLWRQRGDYKITQVELHKLMMKLKKNYFSELPKFYYQPIGQ